MNQEHEMPARIWIDKSLGMVGYINGPPPPESNFRYEYVRADLLATVRREAFKEAMNAVWGLYHKSEVEDSRWNAAIIHARGALEASANSEKGEGDG